MRHLFDIAPLGPLLYDPAVLYAVDDDGRHLIHLSGGCKTYELASVVSESYREAAYHPVAFGCHLILNDEANIGEGSLSLGNELDVALAVRVSTGKRPVIDEVGGEQFVERLQVALYLRLEEAAHKRLVLLCRHGSAPPCQL